MLLSHGYCLQEPASWSRVANGSKAVSNVATVRFFFCGEGAPQLMLRTHRSLKAYCATPKMKMRMSNFFYQVLQVMEHRWNEINRGKPTTRRKTCPSATLSTTNLTWTWPGIEPGPPWWEAGDPPPEPWHGLFFCPMSQQPLGGLGRLIFRGFTIRLRHTTLGRTPLDEWSARRRDLYLTTHNTHNRQTSMLPLGFEPTIPVSERP
jgi:hypothetical protein